MKEGVKQRKPRALDLGEHLDSVRKELGFSANDIGALRSSSALGKVKEEQQR